MSHAYGGGAPSGGPAGVQVEPEIDMKAMPRIVRRIIVMAVQADPFQVILAMFCSLVAAVAGLTVPRLFGGAVNKVAALLRGLMHARRLHESAAQQAALLHHSFESLLGIAGLVILTTTV